MSSDMFSLLAKALGETVYMVAVSMFFSSLLGIPLGVLLYITNKGGILECKPVNKLVGSIVNAVRSIPFIILMVSIIPFTRMIVGSDYRKLIPASALLGASFLLVVDNVSRLATTAEIPIGILTAFIGAPFFLYLITRKKKL